MRIKSFNGKRFAAIVATTSMVFLAGAAVSTAAPAGADSTSGDDFFGYSQSDGSVIDLGSSNVLAAGAQNGYAKFAGVNNNYGRYKVVLVGSSAVEAWRPTVQASVDHLNMSGRVELTLVGGTSALGESAVPPKGQIYVRVDGRTTCSSLEWGQWAGCGGPGIEGTTATSGQVWISSIANNYSQPNKNHLVVHELGHALGLTHYADSFEGKIQVMHPSSYDSSGIQSGDAAGLESLFLYSVQSMSVAKGIYKGFLNRPASQGEVSWGSQYYYWYDSAWLSLAMIHTDEYKSNMVRAVYSNGLDRQPNQVEIDLNVQWLRGGETQQDVVNRVWLSDELWNKAGGHGTAWVQFMYQRLLGRAPSTSELNNTIAAFLTYGKAETLKSFLNNNNYADKVVQDGFQRILGRSAGATELPYWRSVFLSSGYENLLVQLGGSIDFVDNAIRRFP